MSEATTSTSSSGEASASSSEGEETTADTSAVPECGNGVLEDGEVCDDGNESDGDACNATCDVADCRVPVTHATIQLAVDERWCAIISIEPGYYAENVVIDRDVVIEGLLGDPVTVDGGGAGSTFDVQAGEVALRNLQIAGGSATEGGGIHAASPVTLDGCLVWGNEAVGDVPRGGGIYTTSDLALTATQVFLNEVVPNSEFGPPAAGGGIFIDGGELTIVDGSAVDDNVVDAGVTSRDVSGGGIAAIDATGHIDASWVTGNGAAAPNVAVAEGGGVAWTGGSLLVTGSIIEDNEVTGAAAVGGGIAAFGATVDLQSDTLVSANGIFASSGGEGGGVFVDASTLSADAISIAYNFVLGGDGSTAGGGLAVSASDGATTVALTNLSITGNQVSSSFGFVHGGGGFFRASSGNAMEAVVRGCTFANNIAEAATEEHGGGAVTVRASGEDAFASFTAINSTLSENTAVAGNGGAIEVVSGGFGDAASVELYNVTVAENVAGAGGVVGLRVYAGVGTASFRSTGSILDGNGVPGCVAVTANDEGTVELISGGHNVDVQGDCGMTGATASDLTSVDPLLAPLSLWNGGPTATHAIDPLSPARDAGDPGGCLDHESVVLDVDQRGEPRPDAVTCDIGAFELQP